jgi:hypothetical protein
MPWQSSLILEGERVFHNSYIMVKNTFKIGEYLKIILKILTPDI